MTGKVKTQPTDLVWAPAPIAALPILRGRGMNVLRVSCLFLHLFCSCFFCCILFLLLLNAHCSVMGMVKTQSTD